MKHYLFTLLLLLPISGFSAQEDLIPVPEPPDLPAKIENGKPMEADPTVLADRDESSQDEAVPEPPELPKEVEDGEEMEVDITILRKGKNTVQEYRRNGILYMVKIIPDVGPAYYLIDTDGDGNVDVRGSDLEEGININQWKLLEWD